jgi:dTDP-4-dehydrorhamnose reductase
VLFLKKKILIIGGSGLVGKRLYEFLKKTHYIVYATFNKNLIEKNGYISLDITRKTDVDFIFKKIAPDIVIHTAAYSNVEKCEIHRETAFKINVKGTKNIAIASENIGAKIVYISTDYVFDGKKGCYTEIDATNPINYYGVTKYEGEEIIKKICSDFIIARTAVVYGYNKGNFATWIIERLKKGDEINIVIDQYISPT